MKDILEFFEEYQNIVEHGMNNYYSAKLKQSSEDEKKKVKKWRADLHNYDAKTKKLLNKSTLTEKEADALLIPYLLKQVEGVKNGNIKTHKWKPRQSIEKSQ